MPQKSSNVGRSTRESQEEKRRREALKVLLEARERLFAQLADDILSNREVLLEGHGHDGLFSFEFQEIEDRYGARLHALNTLLENLECRKTRLVHKVETVTATREQLARELNRLVSAYDQWDLVALDVTPLGDGRLLAVVAFTADEYVE